MMGNELLRIADGFSMVADGIRGLAGMEWNGAVDMAEKDAGVPGRGRRLGKRIRRRRMLRRRRLLPYGEVCVPAVFLDTGGKHGAEGEA